MAETFITVKSRLTIKKNWINEQELLPREESYWFHSFGMLTVLAGAVVYEIVNDRDFGELIVLLMCLVWIYPHLVRIYQILFVRVWRSNFQLHEIRSVHLDRDYNELEEKVTLTLKSGRQKVYLFRKSEQQAELFVQFIETFIAAQSPVVS